MHFWDTILQVILVLTYRFDWSDTILLPVSKTEANSAPLTPGAAEGIARCPRGPRRPTTRNEFVKTLPAEPFVAIADAVLTILRS